MRRKQLFAIALAGVMSISLAPVGLLAEDNTAVVVPAVAEQTPQGEQTPQTDGTPAADQTQEVVVGEQMPCNLLPLQGCF